jgi:hypothetical protein
MKGVKQKISRGFKAGMISGNVVMETFFCLGFFRLGFFLWLALSERLWFFSRTPLLIISAKNGYVNPLKNVSMTTFWVSNSFNITAH